MRYLSVCSGIEAATVAWHPLGWEAVAFSEIDAFPNSVLAYHYPTVPNLGDMEKFNDWPKSDIDVLVGGTPCQSFSIAGLRKGLADPRGNLTLGYLGVVERFRPRWFVWENVPGAFSSVSHQAPDPSPPIKRLGMGCDGREMEICDDYSADEAHAFACFLAGVSELGYGWAYRVLDAQYFGVPQRRRRVFVVGHSSGAWQRAAAVLLERHSLFRHPAPRRKKGPDIANALAARTGGGGRPDGGDGQHSQLIDETAGPLLAQQNKTGGDRPPGSTVDTASHLISENYVPEIVPQAMSAKWHKGSSGPAGDEHHNLITEDVAAPLTAVSSADSNAPGRRREDDVNIVAEPVGARPYADRGSDENVIVESVGNNIYGGSENRGYYVTESEITKTLDSRQGLNPSCNEGGTVIVEAFKPSHYTRDKDGAPSEVHPPLSADADKGDQEPVVYQCHGDNVGPAGTLRGTDSVEAGVPFTFDETQITSPENRSDPKPGDPAHTIPSHGRPPAVAYTLHPTGGSAQGTRASETDVGYALGVSHNDRGTRIVDTRVRRLTPLECERLQGFPESRDIMDIWVSETRQEHSRLQNVGPAVSGSSTNRIDHEPPVLVTVHIGSEQWRVEIRSPEKSLLSANFAEKKKWSHQLTLLVDSVALIAGINSTPGLATLAGRAELPQSINSSIHHRNGSRPVTIYGPEIAEHASDVGTILAKASRFTTSPNGATRQNYDSITQILSYCVVHAMTGCIQMPISEGSFCARLIVDRGYTDVPGASDSARYRALGNSMAVPVMRWIGERIQQVEDIG